MKVQQLSVAQFLFRVTRQGIADGRENTYRSAVEFLGGYIPHMSKVLRDFTSAIALSLQCVRALRGLCSASLLV